MMERTGPDSTRLTAESNHLVHPAREEIKAAADSFDKHDDANLAAILENLFDRANDHGVAVAHDSAVPHAQ